jgi:NitT/TauT family transport system substrate-binding protein
MLAAQQLALTLPAAVQGQALPLRIGTTPNDSFAEPFYAANQGFFQRAGLNVAVQPFGSGATVTTALAGNAIDIGITNAISLANAVEHGVPFQFFAVAATYNPFEVALCVASDGPINEAKDLNGKTIGTSAIKDANSLHIVAWVDRNGGDSSTIKLIELPYSAMAESIRRGTVVAAPIIEPALTLAIRSGGVRVLSHPMDVYGKNFMVGGWFAHADYIATNAALIRRLRTAIYATAVWANAHPVESAAILAQVSKIDLDVVLAMNRAPYGTALTPAMLQPYYDIGFKYGYLEKHLDASDVIAEV